jgi:hypothetical protein
MTVKTLVHGLLSRYPLQHPAEGRDGTGIEAFRWRTVWILPRWCDACGVSDELRADRNRKPSITRASLAVPVGFEPKPAVKRPFGIWRSRLILRWFWTGMDTEGPVESVSVVGVRWALTS